MLKMFFKNIFSVFTGMGLTLRHFGAARKSKKIKSITNEHYFLQQDGIATIQYPTQKLPVPETGRYQLEVEIDDCIVCDLCAKICPVNCIDIESIKATEAIGTTSDGSVKRLYAAKFDIDMAKCMYCGLCTTVCPTECIIMTDQYDKSVFELNKLIYEFSDMQPDEAEKHRLALAKQQEERQAAKLAAVQKSKDQL